MAARISGPQVAPEAFKAQLGVEHYVMNCGIEKTLLMLIKLRASQINHCAYCIDMHWKDLRAAGESEQRLYGLNAWQESPHYSHRERAALEWTEAVTLLTEGFVPDHVYESVRPHFTERELVDLTMAVAAINSWNRLCVALRAEPGHYAPAKHAAAQN